MTAPIADQWSKVDLHLHTTASDGALTPAELVALAVQRGLAVIAVTDHDSTEGVDAAQAAASATAPSLEVIAGVEVNTDVAQGEAHILGYYLDHHDAALQESLAGRRAARLERGRQIVDRLRTLGFDVQWERVLELAGAAEGGAVGRPHVAQALVEKGLVMSVQEAFEKLIGHGGPAYVPWKRFLPEEAVRLIMDARGIPVLAHPLTWPDFEASLPRLIGAGLQGIECYYCTHSLQQTNELLTLTLRHGLIPTGGSDFHREAADAPTGTLGGTRVPLSVVADLKARRRDRRQ